MRLVVIDAGGTISASDLGRGYEGAGLTADMLEPLRSIWSRGAIEVRRAYAGLSEAMGFDDAVAIVDAIRQACDDPSVGAVVIAHGTDAMEEVAWLCDLLIQTTKPVVFTGAQRTPDAADFDGWRNLGDAVRVAARSMSAGVLIVFGGLVLTAVRARKVHAQALRAFGPDAAVVGRVDDGGVRMSNTPPRVQGLECRRPCPSIEMVALGMGTGSVLLDAAIAPPTRGLILQAMGCGNASAGVVAAVARATDAGLLVGVVTGCFEGQAVAVYESGLRLAEAGAVAMDDLDARRARILMACALGDDRGADEAAMRLRQALTQLRRAG
ncbi:asparaginase [Brevundimonas sp.]|uniref:asparaginase n=1 Tax=Brevundimonas sp. TaxID=1871086 RepID=UPI003BAA4450